ncbi:hypothetical protein Z045_05610 [Rhodococcus pyridinivorans KG-16]|uniref:Uncharacterized protein n=1 Tax=Rhodococcus pyridinivorans KG-16 TaxID=1441730 RepID=A0A0V9UNS9_9NOCA|nr:hypothetical protein [Rhodococcus pyridinivorans]KSZ59648.1 hypothetical protein Z045_05610 [Rhodococcus pyridinivorans KG-16]
MEFLIVIGGIALVAWGINKFYNGYKLTATKMAMVKAREQEELEIRAARELHNREEKREHKRRTREMRRQIEDELGETPPWRRRR